MAFLTVNVSIAADHLHPFHGHADPSTAGYLHLVNTTMSQSLKHHRDMMVLKLTKSNGKTLGCSGTQNLRGMFPEPSLSISWEIMAVLKATKMLHNVDSECKCAYKVYEGINHSFTVTYGITPTLSSESLFYWTCPGLREEAETSLRESSREEHGNCKRRATDPTRHPTHQKVLQRRAINFSTSEYLPISFFPPNYSYVRLLI